MFPVSWPTVVAMVLCALGMAVGGVLIGGAAVGFGRCRTCRRLGQLTDSEGLIQCGACWCRQAQDFASLEHGRYGLDDGIIS
jgi:hypothetical protein